MKQPQIQKSKVPKLQRSKKSKSQQFKNLKFRKSKNPKFEKIHISMDLSNLANFKSLDFSILGTLDFRIWGFSDFRIFRFLDFWTSTGPYWTLLHPIGSYWTPIWRDFQSSLLALSKERTIGFGSHGRVLQVQEPQKYVPTKSSKRRRGIAPVNFACDPLALGIGFYRG